jgi:hypothetical protein
MRRRAQTVATLVVLVASAGLIHAGSTPAQKCAVAKNKAAVKKIGAKAKCWQKAIATGASTADPTCLTAAETKFDAAIAKAEAKGGCANVGDASNIEGAADACVADIIALTPATPLCTPNGNACALSNPGACCSQVCCNLNPPARLVCCS